MNSRDNRDCIASHVNARIDLAKSIFDGTKRHDPATKLDRLTQKVPEKENKIQIVKVQAVDFNARRINEIVCVN
jgi:hypothetical protein